MAREVQTKPSGIDWQPNVEIRLRGGELVTNAVYLYQRARRLVSRIREIQKVFPSGLPEVASDADAWERVFYRGNTKWAVSGYSLAHGEGESATGLELTRSQKTMDPGTNELIERLDV